MHRLTRARGRRNSLRLSIVDPNGVDRWRRSVTKTWRLGRLRYMAVRHAGAAAEIEMISAVAKWIVAAGYSAPGEHGTAGGSIDGLELKHPARPRYLYRELRGEPCAHAARLRLWRFRDRYEPCR